MSSKFLRVGYLVLMMLVLSYPILAQTKDAEIPPAKSSLWYYNRAIIYHLREQDGRATIELYKALDQNSDSPEVNYMMGLLFRDRSLWTEAAACFYKVVNHLKYEHIPARLELARAYNENGEYSSAITALEKVTEEMKLNKEFNQRITECRNIVKPPKRDTVRDMLADDKAKEGLKIKLRDIVEDVEDVLLDSAKSYRNVTLTLGNQDPLIYSQLAALYSDENSVKDSLTVLQEQLKARNGFAPDVLLQMGNLYQKQQRLPEALGALEKAVNQLIGLGFKESAGDFSTQELQQLRAQVKTGKVIEPASDNDTGKNGGNSNKKKGK